MKKILFFLAFPVFCMGQDSIFWSDSNIHFGIGTPKAVVGTCDSIPSDWVTSFDFPHTGSFAVSSFTPGIGWPDRTRECEYWEKTSDWKADNEGSAHCLHEWVMAAHKEVNKAVYYTDLVYRPCGKDGHENFARICAACLRHERCVKSWGWDYKVPEKSEYQKLLEKIQR